MIFLSKGLEDPYINALAKSQGKEPVDPSDFNFDDESREPIVLRGILKKKIIHHCWNVGRDFYFIDTGYFGNEVTTTNPNGWKIWHRVVKNNLQHTHLVKRPSDRFKSFSIDIPKWKKSGDKILIAAPDEKPCKFYGFNLDDWLDNTVNKIKLHTDRPIEIRSRTKNRQQRVLKDSFSEAVKDNVYAVVTFNSNAAVEAILAGIPSFVLSDAHAALPVSKNDLSEIENPYYATEEELFAWGCHLAYGMVHISELKSGKAIRIMEMQ